MKKKLSLAVFVLVLAMVGVGAVDSRAEFRTYLPVVRKAFQEEAIVIPDPKGGSGEWIDLRFTCQLRNPQGVDPAEITSLQFGLVQENKWRDRQRIEWGREYKFRIQTYPGVPSRDWAFNEPEEGMLFSVWTDPRNYQGWGAMVLHDLETNCKTVVRPEDRGIGWVVHFLITPPEVTGYEDKGRVSMTLVFTILPVPAQ